MHVDVRTEGCGDKQAACQVVREDISLLDHSKKRGSLALHVGCKGLPALLYCLEFVAADS